MVTMEECKREMPPNLVSISEYVSQIDGNAISLQSYLQSKIENQEINFHECSDSFISQISKVFLIEIHNPLLILKKPTSFLDIDSCSSFKDFLLLLIRMFLVQKVHNVLTSGFYLDITNNNCTIVEKATSSLMDLFMLPFWKDIYRLLGNQCLFTLFTEYSMFYQLSSGFIVQLAGPTLSQSIQSHNKTRSISLSPIYFRLSFSRYPGLARNHILSRLYQLNQTINRIEVNSPPSAFAYKTIRNDIALILVHHVFKECYSKWKNLTLEEEIQNLKIQYHIQMGEWRRKRIPFPPRLQSCKVELAKLIYNASHCYFAQFLETFTPLPNEYIDYKKQWRTYQHQVTVSANHYSQEFVDSSPEPQITAPLPTMNLHGCVLSIEQVLHFLFACCRRVIPKHLLGSKHNWRAFFRNIQSFIRCPSECFTLEAFQMNIQQSAIPWLSLHHKPTKRDNQQNTQLLGALLTFLITQFLFPLLSNHFYITKSMFAYDPLLFYRKPIFHSIVLNEMQAGYYATVFNRVPTQNWKRKRIATLRFVPKFDSRENAYIGVRPISNLHTIEQSRTIQALFQVLKAIWKSEKTEDMKGVRLYSTENVNEGFQILNHIWEPHQKQYVKTMDIKKCYDNIQLPLLLDIVHSKLTEPYYRIIHYAIYYPSTHHTQYQVQIVPLSHDLFRYLQSASSSSTQCYSGYIASYIYSRNDLFYTLKDTLTNYFIQIQNRYFKQVKGIPQGSILSVPLCNLYVRAYERAQFNAFAGSELQIIRFVDDFLLISTSKELLQQVVALQNKSNRFSIQLVENEQRFFDVRKGRERKSSHMTTWCGFTVDSKRHLMYTNFIKYQLFQNTRRSVKRDNQPFHLIWMSVRRVLFVRLNAISKEEPTSHEDLNNRLIMIYSSVLFALMRTIRYHRIMSAQKMHLLFHRICRFVTKRSFLPMDQVKWIVAFCMITTLRNTHVYVKFLKQLYKLIQKSECKDQLMCISQHPSVFPLYNKKHL